MKLLSKFKLVKEQGYALIIVLWVLVILGVVFVNLVDEIQLNNLLIRDNLEERKVYQAAVSGLMRGINSLQQDQTSYDGQTDNWTATETGGLEGLKYEVKVKGISKLNINYSSYKLLKGFKWWKEGLTNKLNQELIPHLAVKRELFENDYAQIDRLVNTYGRFNLNTGRLSGLKNLLQHLKFDEYEINLIIDYLQEKRDEGEAIDKVSDLTKLYLNGLSPQTLEKLRPYITAQGTLNINFVPRRVLEIVFRQGLEVSRELSKIYADIIINSRQQQAIKEIKQLKQIIYQDNWGRIKEPFNKSAHFIADDSTLSHKERIIQEEISRMKRYFCVSTRYFLIRIKVLSASEEVKERSTVLVKRKQTKDKAWKIEVLRWQN